MGGLIDLSSACGDYDTAIMYISSLCKISICL